MARCPGENQMNTNLISLADALNSEPVDTVLCVVRTIMLAMLHNYHYWALEPLEPAFLSIVERYFRAA